MIDSIELTNYEIFEFCVLNTKTGEKKYYKEKKKIPDFTGLYFRDDDSFFALYPTSNGPIAFYEGMEYSINRELTIAVQKDGKNRRFEIKEYNITINYIESPYIGFDVWSEEIDVDLFYMIEQKYRKDDFYEQYTKR